MKILSNFKDYYDPIARMYGIDDTLIYKRIKITPPEGEVLHPSPYGGYMVAFETKYQMFDNPRNTKSDFQFQWLVILGKRYLLVRPERHGIDQKFELFDPAIHDVYQDRTSERYREKLIKYYIGSTSPQLEQFCKQVGQPVFLVVGSSWVIKKNYVVLVSENIPHLTDYKIPKIIPAQQFYQELDYYLRNVLRENPDKNPPVTIADKDQIVAKGFDIKQSFRHRKPV